MEQTKIDKYVETLRRFFLPKVEVNAFNAKDGGGVIVQLIISQKDGEKGSSLITYIAKESFDLT